MAKASTTGIAVTPAEHAALVAAETLNRRTLSDDGYVPTDADRAVRSRAKDAYRAAKARHDAFDAAWRNATTAEARAAVEARASEAERGMMVWSGRDVFARSGAKTKFAESKSFRDLVAYARFKFNVNAYQAQDIAGRAGVAMQMNPNKPVEQAMEEAYRRSMAALGAAQRAPDYTVGGGDGRRDPSLINSRSGGKAAFSAKTEGAARYTKKLIKALGFFPDAVKVDAARDLLRLEFRNAPIIASVCASKLHYALNKAGAGAIQVSVNSGMETIGGDDVGVVEVNLGDVAGRGLYSRSRGKAAFATVDEVLHLGSTLADAERAQMHGKTNKLKTLLRSVEALVNRERAKLPRDMVGFYDELRRKAGMSRARFARWQESQTRKHGEPITEYTAKIGRNNWMIEVGEETGGGVVANLYLWHDLRGMERVKTGRLQELQNYAESLSRGDAKSAANVERRMNYSRSGGKAAFGASAREVHGTARSWLAKVNRAQPPEGLEQFHARLKTRLAEIVRHTGEMLRNPQMILDYDPWTDEDLMAEVRKVAGHSNAANRWLAVWLGGIGGFSRSGGKAAFGVAERVMRDGTVHLDFAEFKNYISGKNEDSLRYMMKDARDALRANPDGVKANYYADVVNEVGDELRKRGIKMSRADGNYFMFRAYENGDIVGERSFDTMQEAEFYGRRALQDLLSNTKGKRIHVDIDQITNNGPSKTKKTLSSRSGAKAKFSNETIRKGLSRLLKESGFDAMSKDIMRGGSDAETLRKYISVLKSPMSPLHGNERAAELLDTLNRQLMSRARFARWEEIHSDGWGDLSVSYIATINGTKWTIVMDASTRKGYLMSGTKMVKQGASLQELKRYAETTKASRSGGKAAFAAEVVQKLSGGWVIEREGGILYLAKGSEAIPVPSVERAMELHKAYTEGRMMQQNIAGTKSRPFSRSGGKTAFGLERSINIMLSDARIPDTAFDWRDGVLLVAPEYHDRIVAVLQSYIPWELNRLPRIRKTAMSRSGGKAKFSDPIANKISLLMDEGKDRDQAVAIALDMKKRGEI